MSRTPEEQACFDVVYADRAWNIACYPKTLTTLTTWLTQLKKNEPSPGWRQEITREATIQAYEDEIKRLQLLSLIKN